MVFEDGSKEVTNKRLKSLCVKEMRQLAFPGYRSGLPGIEAPGVDFGAHVVLLHDFGDYQIWKVLGHAGWPGLSYDRSYYSPVYYLVEVLKWDAEWLWAALLREARPGRRYSRLIGSWLEHLGELGVTAII